MDVAEEDPVPPQAYSHSAWVIRKSPTEGSTKKQGGPETGWHYTNIGQKVSINCYTNH